MELKYAIDEFIINRRVKGCSTETIKLYKDALKRFINYMSEDISINCLTVRKLNDYYLYLSKFNISSSTIQNRIRVLRSFLNWCFAEDYIKERLTDRFRLPKAKRNVIDILNQTEIQKLLEMFNQSNKTGLRNYCICMLMLDCGLRLKEVVTLQVENIYINEKYMIVDGKGNKQRIVPIGTIALESVKKYLSARGSASGTLFYSSRKLPLSTIAVSKLFHRLKKETKINRLKPHLLRHTFATMYLENGGEIYSLQAILGHTSLEMVKRYLHLSKNKIVGNFHKFSPMDNIKYT